MIGFRPDIKGCSRTDAGVHALGFALSFEANLGIPPAKLPLALNTKLPRDIRVLKAQLVPDGFHARYAAHTKTYLYRIHNSPIDSPFEERYYCRMPGRLELGPMQRAAAYFVGKHDFLALCAAHSSAAAHGGHRPHHHRLPGDPAGGHRQHPGDGGRVSVQYGPHPGRHPL